MPILHDLPSLCDPTSELQSIMMLIAIYMYMYCGKNHLVCMIVEINDKIRVFTCIYFSSHFVCCFYV